MNMARNGVVSNRRWKSESGIDICGSDTQAEAHVLAVDDSVIDRKVIERLLKTTSCKVTAVDSGLRALQYLGLVEDQRSSVVDDGLKVDLIITDYCMPGMTGYELLKKIKESSTFKETPVVIMSSENVLARIDRCLEEGAEDFILKPVKLADVKRIKNYMSKEDGSKSGNNKRKERDGSDHSSESQSPPMSRSPSSDSSSSPSTSPLSSSQSPPSISPLTPLSPSETLDSPATPCSPSGPLDCRTPSSPSPEPSGPLDSPTRRIKMTTSDLSGPTS